MSSALMYFIFAGSNISFTGSTVAFPGIPSNLPIANYTIQIPSIDLTVNQSTPTAAPEIQPRRLDYTYTPGVGAHKIHSTAKTWNDARLACEKEGATLAIINSPAESQAIAQLFPKSLPHNGSENSGVALVGFHDLYHEGQYVTIHGDSLEKAGFNEWYPGEPNNDGGNENCGSVWSTGGLNDVSCDYLFAYVCELLDNESRASGPPATTSDGIKESD